MGVLTSPQAPKLSHIFYKKRVAPFLFYMFYKFRACNALFFHKIPRLRQLLGTERQLLGTERQLLGTVLLPLQAT